jgi:Sigma-70, region 4
MASLDTLPADQRAVLSLVLERGKSYDEIAQMLSIDRTSVRERALAAFDALGPQTQISDLRRALITDYLLGQLPPAVAQETCDRLAANPSERAWARVLASDLAPLSSGPLPEIPAAGPAAPAAVVAARNGEPDGVAPLPAVPAAAADGNGDSAAGATALGSPEPEPDKPRSSRVGGIILLVGAALVVIAVVLVIVLSSGGSSSSNSSSAAASVSASSSTATNPTAPLSSTSGAAASTTPTVVAQINLKPPSGGGKSEAGIAEVLKQGSKKGIAIVAQHMPPNTRKPPNAYAVWLYNSSNDAKLLGFVNPGVGKNGRLSTAGQLPTNASHFHKLIITLETTASPKTPGAVVLSGAFTGA